MERYDSGTHADRDALWDWNLASDRIHFSPRWMALIGCQDDEIGNTPEEWFQRVHPEDLDEVLRELESARSEGSHEFAFRHRLRHQDGTYRWVACRGVAMRDGKKVTRLAGSHTDVTADTVTDRSTGLPNRLLLTDRLNRSIERARLYQGFHFALLLIDIGRPGGREPGAVGQDPLLTSAARRLETCLRIGDTSATLRHNDLVARIGGDQFTILLDGLKVVSHVKVVADRILSRLLTPLSVQGRDLYLSPSIGIAVSATGYATADDVLRDADIALHRARVLGGSRCEIFDTEVLTSEETDLQIEQDLAGALERNELELLYQPIVSLSSNQIVGFEALVRWKHPVLGLISPTDFIPIAERTGLIVPLGNWVLREACLRLKAWRDELPHSADLWMSVNLSSVQLRESTLVDQVANALRDAGVDAHKLVLELTEGTAMDNPTAAKMLLMQLRALGVRISIDDFGTGYSSLAYLRQLPVDALKVDRSFVRGIKTDKGCADIVATLTAMAKEMGVSVVIEGVENEEQLELIRSLHCESAQGYLFAKPLDVTSAVQLIKSGLPGSSRTPPTTKPAVADGVLARTTHRLYGSKLLPKRGMHAAAAILALLAVGFAGRFMAGIPPAVPPPSPAPFDPDASSRSVSVVTFGPVSDVMPVPSVSRPMGSTDRSTKAVATEEPTTPERGTPRPRGETKPLIDEPAPPAAATLTSAKVVHLHRFGSCAGHLVLSADGLAFVPDGHPSNDAFSLKHGEFLDTLADDRLTITSHNKTYRFRVAEQRVGMTAVRLRDFVDSIALFR